jgi:Zn-dependent protease
MQAPADSLKNKGARFGLIAVILAAAANFKTTATLALQGAGILKFGWLFKSALTMVLSLAVYTFAFGWGFAAMFISLLMVHELGHWIWIRANKLDSTAPIFIPFVGAIIAMKQMPAHESTTAWIAFAGPLVGSAGALIVWLLGCALNNGALMSGGSFGFMLNLFQLIPAKPLDGGFVLGTVSRIFLVPGMIVLFLMAIATHSALLVILCVLSIGYFRGIDKNQNPLPERQKTIGEYEAELLGKPANATALPAGASGASGTSAASAASGASGAWAASATAGASRAPGASAAPAASGGASGAPSSTVSDPKPVTFKQRLAIALSYFALAGFLGYMQVVSFQTIEQRFHTANPFDQLGVKIPKSSD